MEEASESCFCSETLDIILGIGSGVLKRAQLHYKAISLMFTENNECYYHQGLPPTLSLFHVPEIPCFRDLLVQLSAQLPPHLSLLT